MFIQKYSQLILFILFGVSSMSYSNNNDFIIRTSVDMKYAFCDIKTNDVSGVNNRSEVLDNGLGFGTTSTNSMVVMQNGQNTLTIEMASPQWFSAEKQSKDTLNQFNPNAKCEITVNQIKKNGDILPLATMLIKINDKGQPEAYHNGQLDSSVEKRIIKAKNTQKVANNKLRDYIQDNEYPRDMTLFQFNKQINIAGIPNWPWDKASRFENTPEQQQLLRDAYSELWLAFEQKNTQKIKELLTPSLNIWSISTGGTPDKQYESHEFVEDFKQKSFKMAPIDWSNFEPLIMNNGKMVKLVYKEDFDYSPISYSYIDEDNDEMIGYYAPIFSLIDGKFVPVI